MRLFAFLLALGLWLGLTNAGHAAPELCERAAQVAAAESGVPGDVMLAIALAETGRSHHGRLRPWPWAANTGGPGHWFDTREAAEGFARARIAAGSRNIDLGCFQINWHWHGTAFHSPGAAFDPLENARYAAAFLARLHAEFGSWEAAAGAYHSRRPDAAARYAARFAALRATLGPDLRAAAPRVAARAPSALARLDGGAGGVRAAASLVALGGPAAPFLETRGAGQ